MDQITQMCYPKCMSGYTGGGPLCWKNCAEGTTACGGILCLDNRETCTQEILTKVTAAIDKMKQAAPQAQGALFTSATFLPDVQLPICNMK